VGAADPATGTGDDRHATFELLHADSFRIVSIDAMGGTDRAEAVRPVL